VSSFEAIHGAPPPSTVIVLMGNRSVSCSGSRTESVRQLTYWLRDLAFLLPRPEVTESCPHPHLGGRHVCESRLDR
jgi:hypothetical protein